MYTVKKYTQELKEEWDNFVTRSKNGTFLFYRDFMEYHADRFIDFSLLIYQKQKLVAVFPANVTDNKVHSHQGLTYGGLILEKSLGGEKIKNICNIIIQYYRKHKSHKILIKPIPRFYQHIPSNELEFFVVRAGGTLVKKDLNLAIDYRLPLSFHKTKLKKYKKAKEYNLRVEENGSFSEFWELVLLPRLKSKHQVKPVHSIAEIELLRKRFPQHIVQYNIYKEHQILAGITTFQDNYVIKSQYGATTPEGQKWFALDYLFMSLITNYKAKGFKFFDMGSVTEDNYGLLKQKEELGCEIYSQDYLELDIT